MEITPPRNPRLGTGSAILGTSGPRADVNFPSKLPEEAKGSSASLIKRTVVVVADEINAPVFTDPLAPCNSQSLTLEIAQAYRGSNQLKCLFAKASANRKVV